VLADLAVGIVILAGSVLAYYLVFRFGWDLLLRSGAVRQLKGQWRYFSVVFLGLVIGASSTIAFFQGPYWLALGLFVGGMVLGVTTNLLRFRAAERH
jgi:hypothetical protein